MAMTQLTDAPKSYHITHVDNLRGIESWRTAG